MPTNAPSLPFPSTAREYFHECFLSEELAGINQTVEMNEVLCVLWLFFLGGLWKFIANFGCILLWIFVYVIDNVGDIWSWWKHDPYTGNVDKKECLITINRVAWIWLCMLCPNFELFTHQSKCFSGFLLPGSHTHFSTAFLFIVLLPVPSSIFFCVCVFTFECFDSFFFCWWRQGALHVNNYRHWRWLIYLYNSRDLKKMKRK